MTHRKYEFELPYEVSSFYVWAGYGRLKDQGILARLPKKLRDRIGTAYTNGDAIKITREDCDSIDDETWAKLASMLDLRYSQ